MFTGFHSNDFAPVLRMMFITLGVTRTLGEGHGAGWRIVLSSGWKSPNHSQVTENSSSSLVAEEFCLPNRKKRASQRAMKATSFFSKNIRALVAIGVCAIAVAGCGGSSAPAAGAHEHHEGHEHGGHDGHEHPEMTGPMREMHDVLAPLWHAEKSPERENKTCEAVPTFTQRAGRASARRSTTRFKVRPRT